MTKVSVVVPVYNVEKHLHKCLNSLVNQKLKEIEIIVVNDGSPDNSQKIIDDYVFKYPNKIKAFVKENGGLSDARNYGLKFAVGEYIGFLDSDDYVELDMFEKMYNKAKSKDFDIVVCDVNVVNDNETFITSSLVNKDLFTTNEVKQQMKNIYPTAWNKLYKKSLFENGVLFKKNIWYEDVEFLYRLFPYIRSIGVVKEPLVNYIQSNSAITKTFDNRLYCYIENWNGIIQFYKEHGIFEEYYNELEYCYVRYLYSTFIIQATNFDKKEYNRAVSIARENVKFYFPKYRKNKYFHYSLQGIYMMTICCLSANLIYYCNGIIKKIFLRR